MESADYAAREGLAKVGGRPPLAEYLSEVWKRRLFIYSMARFRIESENQQNSLGMVWVILKPLLNALVYGLIFGFLIGGGRPSHFVEYLIIGVFVFEFFATSWSGGGRSVVNNGALVQSLAFPRMVLPLAVVTQRFLQFMPTVVIMLVFLIISGIYPDVHWLELVPMLVMYFFFNCGLALVTARLSVHWRDLNNFIPFIIRIFFYTTGIFFSVEQRFGPSEHSDGHPLIVTLSNYQPVHAFLTVARAALLPGKEYDADLFLWTVATVWSVVLFVFGAWFFWRAEERYGRVD